MVENVEELEKALAFPWDKWTVFLHPSQRAVVDQVFSGPAKVAGSAGTGKTVVALHRAARLAADPNSRVLLTTFSQPLANALRSKLAMLVGDQSPALARVTIAPFRGIAEELYQLAFGRRPQIASEEQNAALLAKAAGPDSGFTSRFLMSEWTHVFDAWQINSAEAYAEVPRLGRKNRLGAKQRARLWPIFDDLRKALAERHLMTWPQVFGDVAQFYASREEKPFASIVVDEAQDLGVPELRFLAAIAGEGPDALFFAGDIGQRIFQQPFSWKALGIDVRGRSRILNVNYRTSHQIRRAAGGLLPKSVRNVDGVVEDRSDTVSVFNGPEPIISRFETEDDEARGIGAFINRAISDGILPAEIGVFVRSREQLKRARAAVREAGFESFEISESGTDSLGRVSIGTMHLAKGLEFRAVVVMACDDELLPLAARIETAADEIELDEVYETERQLLYVACTRARDRLLVSAVAPGSEFLGDIRP